MANLVHAKSITIYVKATKMPYIHAWESGDGGNILTPIPPEKKWNESPGLPMTASTEIQGTSFWYMTFETERTINVLFNSGPGPVVVQTKDINDISTDRYFEYNGTNQYTDISDQYIEVPDAVIEFLALSGNHKADWDTNDIFSELEKGKKFEIFVDLTDVVINDDDEISERWEFRLRPNGQGSINAKNTLVIEDPDKVLDTEDPSIDNFVVYLDEIETYQFTITATWAGGKDSQAGWTVCIVKGNQSASISDIKSTVISKSTRYNLQGQRVSNNFRGIAIQNGKKFAVK